MKTNVLMVALLVAFVVLPGCGWFSKSEPAPAKVVEPPPPIHDLLKSYVCDPNPEVKVKSKENILWWGVKAIPGLEAELGSDDPKIGEAAAELLGYIPEAFERMKLAIADRGSATKRVGAKYVLGKYVGVDGAIAATCELEKKVDKGFKKVNCQLKANEKIAKDAQSTAKDAVNVAEDAMLTAETAHLRLDEVETKMVTKEYVDEQMRIVSDQMKDQKAVSDGIIVGIFRLQREQAELKCRPLCDPDKVRQVEDWIRDLYAKHATVQTGVNENKRKIEDLKKVQNGGTALWTGPCGRSYIRIPY